MPQPHERRALKDVTDHALNIKNQSKPGPKPKPLHLRRAAQEFMPAIKREIKRRPREFKLKVLCYWKYALVADEDSDQSQRRHVTWQEVSQRYKVKKATLFGWKAKENVILQSEKNTRTLKNPGVCAYPEMEQALYTRFVARRDEGLMVRRVWFRLASRLCFREAYPALDPNQFRFSAGWFSGFLSRWGLSLRVSTNTASKVPEDYRCVILEWLRFNRRNSQIRPLDVHFGPVGGIGRYSLACIANMDQTPLPFEYISGRTYALKGDKTVWAKSVRSGWDKRQATLMFTVFADGIMRLKPIIIFKGSADPAQQARHYGDEQKLYDSRVLVWYNKKGYANTEVLLRWIDEQLIPAFNPHGPRLQPVGTGISRPWNPSIVALDAARFHRGDDVLEKLRAHDIVPSLIPGGCTGLVQVLDVAVNKPFKGILRNVLDENMETLGEEALNALDDATDSAVGRKRILMTHAVGEAWERFSHGTGGGITRKAFRQVGMSLPIDGSLDQELKIKGIQDVVIGDWRRETRAGLIPPEDQDNEMAEDGDNVEITERDDL